MPLVVKIRISGLSGYPNPNLHIRIILIPVLSGFLNLYIRLARNYGLYVDLYKPYIRGLAIK